MLPNARARFRVERPHIAAPVREVDDPIDYCGAGFHTYAVDWRPDGIDLWVDGRKTGLSFPNPSTQPMYVVLSLAAGGGWAGTPDLASLPAELTVDFVRVWQRRGSN